MGMQRVGDPSAGRGAARAETMGIEKVPHSQQTQLFSKDKAFPKLLRLFRAGIKRLKGKLTVSKEGEKSLLLLPH